ncbi:MAG: 3'-5' exonuclease [Paraglaciecola sp.]
MRNVSLDIETMGVTINAAIMSIGACYFEPATGQIGETFHMPVNIASNGKIDAPTVIWWMGQSDEARNKFIDNDKAKSIEEVLTALAKFLKPDAQVWGNGIAFDNVIVRNAYENAQQLTPWEFRNDRDVRTMVELGRAIGFNPKVDMPFEGVKHDALADAIHQAKYVSAIWQKLMIKNASEVPE